MRNYSNNLKIKLKYLDFIFFLVNGIPKRSTLSVKYDKLGLRVKAPGDLTELELDEALDALVYRVQSQESSALQQLETIGVILHKFSVSSINECLIVNDNITNNSNRLKDVIRSYFDEEVLLDIDFNKQVSFHIYIYIMFSIFIKSYFIDIMEL